MVYLLYRLPRYLTRGDYIRIVERNGIIIAGRSEDTLSTVAFVLARVKSTGPLNVCPTADSLGIGLKQIGRDSLSRPFAGV